MTFEARLASVLFFFLIWCIVGLFPWVTAAVLTRGRGALPALPLALGAACVCGVAVPLGGLRDATGFLLSLVTAAAGATIATIIGLGVAHRVEAGRPAGARRVPPLTHRPPTSEAASTAQEPEGAPAAADE